MVLTSAYGPAITQRTNQAAGDWDVIQTPGTPANALTITTKAELDATYLTTLASSGSAQAPAGPVYAINGSSNQDLKLNLAGEAATIQYPIRISGFRHLFAAGGYQKMLVPSGGEVGNLKNKDWTPQNPTWNFHPRIPGNMCFRYEVHGNTFIEGWWIDALDAVTGVGIETDYFVYRGDLGTPPSSWRTNTKTSTFQNCRLVGSESASEGVHSDFHQNQGKNDATPLARRIFVENCFLRNGGEGWVNHPWAGQTVGGYRMSWWQRNCNTVLTNVNEAGGGGDGSMGNPGPMSSSSHAETPVFINCEYGRNNSNSQDYSVYANVRVDGTSNEISYGAANSPKAHNLTAHPGLTWLDNPGGDEGTDFAPEAALHDSYVSPHGIW